MSALRQAANASASSPGALGDDYRDLAVTEFAEEADELGLNLLFIFLGG